MPMLTAGACRSLWPGAARCAILLVLVCLRMWSTGSSVVGVNRPASGAITKAQAVAYAHAVNLASR